MDRNNRLWLRIDIVSLTGVPLKSIAFSIVNSHAQGLSLPLLIVGLPAAITSSAAIMLATISALMHRFCVALVRVAGVDSTPSVHAQDENQWKRISQEVKLMEKLNHPRVIRLFETVSKVGRCGRRTSGGGEH